MKDRRVTVPLTETDFQIWKQYAEEREISLPEFIRRGVSMYIRMLEKWKEKSNKSVQS